MADSFKYWASAPFGRMRDFIEGLPAGATLGGAVVIVPPEGGGEIIEMLVLDTRQDPLLFYSNIQKMAEVAFNDIVEKRKRDQALGIGVIR